MSSRGTYEFVRSLYNLLYEAVENVSLGQNADHETVINHVVSLSLQLLTFMDEVIETTQASQLNAEEKNDFLEQFYEYTTYFGQFSLINAIPGVTNRFYIDDATTSTGKRIWKVLVSSKISTDGSTEKYPLPQLRKLKFFSNV